MAAVVSHYVEVPDVTETDGVLVAASGEGFDVYEEDHAPRIPLEPCDVPYIFDLEKPSKHVLSKFVPLYDQFKTTLQSLRLVLYKFRMIVDRSMNTDKKPTHTALNDGKFCVEGPENEAIFDRAIAMALASGYRLFFNEISTAVFRFFCDLDFIQVKQLKNQHAEAVAVVVQRAIKTCFEHDESFASSSSAASAASTSARSSARSSDDFFKCIVCAADPKVRGPDSVKTGIHLIFPNIFVVQSQAVLLREVIICELQKTLGRRQSPQNSWDDVVDLSVYRKAEGACLRMVGHCKVSPCPSCRGKKPAVLTCETCYQIGRVDEGRPYMPMCVLDGTHRRDLESEKRYLSNMIELVQDTKIRNTTVSPEEVEGNSRTKVKPLFGFKRPESMPINQADFDDITSSTASSSKTYKPVKPKLAGRFKTFDTTDETFSELQQFIQTGINDSYNDVLIKEILANSKNDVFIVHVRGPGCLYCQNVSREHRSNNVYFEITMTGICQRCFKVQDNAKDTSSRVSCKDYRSKMKRLPSSLLEVFFPISTSSSSSSTTSSTTSSTAVVPRSTHSPMMAYRFPWSKSTDIRVRKSAEAEIGGLLMTLDALGTKIGFTKSMSSALGWSFDRPGRASTSDDIGSLGLTGLRKAMGLPVEVDTEDHASETEDDHFARYESSVSSRTEYEVKLQATKDLVSCIVRDLARPGFLESSLRALKKCQKGWGLVEKPPATVVKSFFQYL